jgi:hypothetical protein
MATRREYAFALVYTTLSRVNDRYEELRQLYKWKREPTLAETIAGFTGVLTSALSMRELAYVRGYLQEIAQKHETMLARQRGWGFAPRALDLAYVAVCGEALEALQRGTGAQHRRGQGRKKRDNMLGRARPISLQVATACSP